MRGFLAVIFWLAFFAQFVPALACLLWCVLPILICLALLCSVLFCSSLLCSVYSLRIEAIHLGFRSLDLL